MGISKADQERIAYAQSLLDSGVFRDANPNWLTGYIELCEAIGLNAKNMDPTDIFLLAGRILQQVRDLDRLAGIKRMTKEDVDRLRDRVVCGVEFPRARR